MADSTTSWLRRFQPSRAQPQPKQQPQPVITSALEDSFVTSLTTVDGTNGSENFASPLSHPTAATSSKYHYLNGGGVRVVSNSESGSGNGNGNGSGGTTFGGNATGPIPPPPPPPPKTPTAGIFSSGTASTTASLRRPSLPHQKSPSDSNVNSTSSSSKLLRSRPSATFQRVSSLLNLGGGGGGNGTTNSPSVTAPSSPSFSSGRPREGSGGSTSRFTFFRPSTPSAVAPAAAPAPAPSLSALPLSNWSATNGEDEDDYWLGGGERGGLGRNNTSRESNSPWYNPNLMQMAETLQAVMMTKGDSMAALPVQYNSLVHSVLEGFAHLTKRLKALKQELAELRNLREKELEQFRGISEEWIQREDGYKAEIKRLEVVLAKESKDGLASVTLARQHTLIDRSASKRFQARLKRMSITPDRDRAGEGDYDNGIKVVEEHLGYEVNGIIDVSLRNTPMDNDVYVSQLIKKRAVGNRGRRRSQLQQSMVPPPVEETLVESSSPSSSPPSPTKPYSYSNGLRSSHTQQPNMSPVKEGPPCNSSSTSSSSTASTVSAEASRSLSQRRNINNLVIETGDVSSTAVNPRQRRIFSYIEGEAEVLTTASDNRQRPFQNYYEFANTFRQQDLDGRSSDKQQSLADINAHDLPDGTATSRMQTKAAEDVVDRASTTLRTVDEEDSTTSLIGTSSSRSSNLPGLTPSNSTGSVIWVGKRNSRAAGAAAVTSTTSVSEALDQPGFYETGVGGAGENYELREMTSSTTTTAAEAPAPRATTYYQYDPNMVTVTTATATETAMATRATSPKLAPVPSPRAGSTGPAIPPRTTSHQQQQQQFSMKVGSVSPIKDKFEQLLSEQQKQSTRNVKEKSPVRKAADKKKMRDEDNKNTSNVSATVAMFNERT